MVVAVIALIVALGGTSYAALKLAKNSVGTKQLKGNAVTSPKVRDRSLLAHDFKAGQLPAGERGPIGPQGATGTTGATGATGPSAAKSFVCRANFGQAGTGCGTVYDANGLKVEAGCSASLRLKASATVAGAVMTHDFVRDDGTVGANMSFTNTTPGDSYQASFNGTATTVTGRVTLTPTAGQPVTLLYMVHDGGPQCHASGEILDG
jgi:hypothetical protein